jgi:hypothetical protein
MTIQHWYGPLKIVLVYILVGSLWIFLSDGVEQRLSLMFPGTQWVQTAKGIFYVLTTGILLFYLIHSYANRQRLFCQLLNDKNLLLQSIIETQRGMNVLVVDKAMNIAVDLGNDNLFGQSNLLRCHFPNLNELKLHLPWFDTLQQAILATWRYGNYKTVVETDNDVFQLEAMLVKTHSTGEPVVLVIFTKTTEATV